MPTFLQRMRVCLTGNPNRGVEQQRLLPRAAGRLADQDLRRGTGLATFAVHGKADSGQSGHTLRPTYTSGFLSNSKLALA